MAGDWIKMRKTLSTDPDVVQIATVLGCDTDAAVGKVFRFWSWLDDHTENGNALSVTEKWIDVTLMCAPGFCAALRKVGWLSGSDGCLHIPNFERHNGKSAKKRALTRDRVTKIRGDSCNAASVTKALPEKKRKEKSNTPHSPPTGGRGKPSPEFEAWWKSYPVRGNPGKRGDKQAAWETWQRLTDQQREKVPKATARLIASGQLPKDAERFLRPPRGGKTPEFETWLEDTTAAPVAGTGKSAVQRKEAQNHDEDYAWLTESK